MIDTRDEFVELIRANARAMFRAARSVLDSDAQAEDAVGEAILTAWQKLDSLRDPNAARTWLVRLAVNKAIDERRRTSRLTSTEELLELAAPERAASPWEAVCALPPDRRTAVVLYYYEGMKVREIARVLNISVGTVKSRLARARRELWEMLKEDEL